MFNYPTYLTALLLTLFIYTDNVSAQNSNTNTAITDPALSINQMKWRSVGPPRGGRANTTRVFPIMIRYTTQTTSEVVSGKPAMVEIIGIIYLMATSRPALLVI